MDQPLTSARVVAVLSERTRSLSIDDKLAIGRGKSTSPIRAKVKRRRSVASAPGDTIGRQLIRKNSPAVPFDRSILLPRNEAEPKFYSQETEAQQQQMLLNGSSRKRRISHADEIKSRKRNKAIDENKTSNKLPGLERSESIKRLLKVTKGPERSLVPPLSLSGDVEDYNQEAAYERRGAFRLKRDIEGSDEFRFPKPHNRPEPLWRAGDGFSVEEVRPNFVFLMTGSHKQKKANTIPGLGELQLETGDGSKEDLRSSGISRRKTQHISQYETKHRRGVAKDVWPTIDNFTEELEVRKRNPTVLENEKIISSTMRPQPTPAPRARETIGYNPLSLMRKRRASHFENFGQRLGNDNMISNTCITETQIDPTQPESEESFGDEAEYEEYEVEGEEEDYEPVPSTSTNREIDGNAEHNLSNKEDTSSDASSKESGIRDSAIFVPNNTGHKSQELERKYDDIWAAGDIGREVLGFSQAFS
ncbi:hypothetical protein F4781DRAFT_434609 [Annulohypoxylon bovei var. microspora]|nr:hypothetical protein F4781DRAFT_434609 [Annulohypoxylon bovei var. microspora]